MYISSTIILFLFHITRLWQRRLSILEDFILMFHFKSVILYQQLQLAFILQPKYNIHILNSEYLLYFFLFEEEMVYFYFLFIFYFYYFIFVSIRFIIVLKHRSKKAVSSLSIPSSLMQPLSFQKTTHGFSKKDLLIMFKILLTVNFIYQKSWDAILLYITLTGHSLNLLKISVRGIQIFSPKRMPYQHL